MEGTKGRRVTRNYGGLIGPIDGRIKWCSWGIEFNCCQGEVFVVAIWAASGNRGGVSLPDSSRWPRNVGKGIEKVVRGRRRPNLDGLSVFKITACLYVRLWAGTDAYSDVLGM